MKAKVIIDFPKNCDKCPFIAPYWVYDWRCSLAHRRIDDTYVMPDFCPLEPILDLDGIKFVARQKSAKKVADVATAIIKYYAENPQEIEKILGKVKE